MYDDIHITRELLQAVATGELPPKILLDLAGRHLMNLCAHCRAEFEAFSQGRRPLPATECELAESLVVSQEELVQARTWIDELKQLAPDHRIGRVERARTRFRGRMFTRCLIEESRASLPDDPRESHTWAHLALASVFYAKDQDDLFVRAIAYQANALRLLGEPAGAREAFEWARRFIQQRGVMDIEVYAELDRLQASLHLDLRAFDEAEQLLSRAAMLYGLLKDSENGATVLLKLSVLHSYRGDIELALQTDRKVLGLVNLQRSPRLYMYARFNLAYDLVEAGDIASARDLLAYDEDLYEEHGDETIRINVLWLAGRIAAVTGSFETAESKLSEARDAYAKRGNGFDVACICLDLALLYFQAGDFEKLKEVASQAVFLFGREEVHRDALAALILLRDAARAETLTSAAIEKVARFLKKARANPSAHFEPTN